MVAASQLQVKISFGTNGDEQIPGGSHQNRWTVRCALSVSIGARTRGNEVRVVYCSQLAIAHPAQGMGRWPSRSARETGAMLWQ